VPALLLALLVGTAAAAQPFALARAPQRRSVTLPATREAPLPEVYVAPGVTTTLVFASPLERASLVLDEQVAHFALVDVGDQTISLEPRGELAPEKRLGLKARLKDGTQVTLVVSTHPTRVDDRVNVERPRSVEALLAQVEQMEAQLAALKARSGEGGPMGWLRSGMLDGRGVLARRIDAPAPAKNETGLRVIRGLSFRATKWTLVDVEVRNLPGQAPWTPLKAWLVGPGGLTAKGVSVWMEKARLAPGEAGRVLVQTEAPFWKAGTELRLEILDSDGGRQLSIPGVKL
jgi:uncharacterized protein (TIGR02268 family)